MRTLFFASVSAVALIVAAPVASAQQAVVCVNCSTTLSDAAHQVWEGLQWARNLEQQLLQVEYEIRSWTTLLQNTVSLPSRIFNDVTGEINRIEGIADQISHFSEQTQFMVSNLGHPSGWGGSLDDIPRALAQEDMALAAAMKKLGAVNDQTQPLSQQYTAQLASLEGTGVSGMTQAVQVGNSIQATIGQQQAAQATQMNAALQALATAEIRRADRDAMIGAKVRADRADAIAAACSQLTSMSPPVCQQQPGAVPASGSYVAVASGTQLPSGLVVPESQTLAINAAPNTP